MLKYSFRIFNEKDELILSAIVPMEHIFDWLDKYKDTGIIKCYIISDDSQ